MNTFIVAGPSSSYPTVHLFRNLINHHEDNKNNNRKGNINELVKRSVEVHIARWWSLLLERELKDNLDPEDQVEQVIAITDECYLFIALATSFYSPIFVNDFNLPYLRVVYLYITKKINPCVRPLLMNLYSRYVDSKKI